MQFVIKTPESYEEDNYMKLGNNNLARYKFLEQFLNQKFLFSFYTVNL